MFYFDPLYMLLIIIGIPLVFIPQWWVKRTYEKFARVPASGGRRGVDVALDILRHQGVHDVSVEPTPGLLSDHYDPASKTVRLSEEIYYGTSVSAVAVAAHECGHAIQHARGFFPVVLRSAMVPAVNFGSQLGPILIFASLFMMGMQIVAPDMAILLAWFGALLFGLAVVFHIVTLPVEIDASMRGIGILKSTHYLTARELPMAKHVLTAAAFTYVATALYAMMQLLYFVIHILAAQRQR